MFRYMQDLSLYTQDSTEAPTATLRSICMVAAIAAHVGQHDGWHNWSIPERRFEKENSYLWTTNYR